MGAFLRNSRAESSEYPLATIAATLYFGQRFKLLPMAVFLGLSTAVRMPLAVLAIPLSIWYMTQKRRLWPLCAALVLAVAVSAPQLTYNLYRFGHLSPLGDLFSVQYASAHRFWAFWLLPGQGMIWFYPAIVWCVLRMRWPWWFTASTILAALVVFTLTCFI